ncbi:MAG: hypothetical protein JXB14_07210 [Candidatus Altiarchaeota archaeon]|nr:hypothetical protein [Candidatus Altiarchaeota archaeon]
MDKKLLLIAALAVFGLTTNASSFYLERELAVNLYYNTSFCSCSTIWVEIDGHGRENCTEGCEYDLNEFINCSWVNLSDSLSNCSESLNNAMEQLYECQTGIINNLSYLDTLIQERCTASEVIQLNLEEAVSDYRTALAAYWNETYLPARADYEALRDQIDSKSSELDACNARDLELNKTLGERNDAIRGLQGQNNLEFWVIILLIFGWVFSKFWFKRAEYFGKLKKPGKHKHAKPPVPGQYKPSTPQSSSASPYAPPSMQIKQKKKRRGLIGRLI